MSVSQSLFFGSTLPLHGTAAKSIISKSLVYSQEPELSFVSGKVYVWHVRSVHGTIINVPVLLHAPEAPCLEAQCCNV